MEKTTQTFSKSERISGRSAFDRLFRKGSSFNLHPLRVVWLVSVLPQEFPAQVAVGVPKRICKKAVDRNRIKRLLREAYRKNKKTFYDELEKRGVQVQCTILCTNRNLTTYTEAEHKIVLTLQRLLKEYDAGRGREKKPG